MGASYQGALRLRSGKRARRRQGVDRTLAKGRTDRCARWRTRHHQGQHRDQRRAGAARCGDDQTGAGGSGRAAIGTIARSWRDHLLQDHHAGFRHAVIGSFELPSPHPQSLGPRHEPRWLQRRCQRGRRRRLRPASSWHRYRRLGPAAGRLVRSRWAEAQPRTGSRRSALCRPRRRADDPHSR